MVKINETRARAEKLYRELAGSETADVPNVERVMIQQALLSVRNEAIEDCALKVAEALTTENRPTGYDVIDQVRTLKSGETNDRRD